MFAAPYFTAESFGDFHYGIGLALVDGAPSLCQVGGIACQARSLRCVHAAYQVSGLLCTVVVHYHHRHVAHQLAVVYQGVYHGVGQRQEQEEQHDTLVAAYGAEFPGVYLAQGPEYG